MVARSTSARHFTLIELVIVIALIATVGSALAIGGFKAVERSRFESLFARVCDRIHLAEQLMGAHHTEVVLTLTEEGALSLSSESVRFLPPPLDLKGHKLTLNNRPLRHLLFSPAQPLPLGELTLSSSKQTLSRHFRPYLSPLSPTPPPQDYATPPFPQDLPAA